MSGRKSAVKISAKKGFKALGSALLLFFYLAGNSGSGILHELLHNEHTTVSHSPEHERDVCHRAIYHFGKDPKHNSHFAVSEKSDNCQVLAHTEQILTCNPPLQCIEGKFAEPEGLNGLPFASVCILLPSRAPPVI